MAQFNQNLVFNGLGTFTLLTAPFAGDFLIMGNITLPTLVGGAGASAVVATMKVNAAGDIVGAAGATGFMQTLNLAAGDVVTVVLASSAGPDQPRNVIKTTVAVSYV